MLISRTHCNIVILSSTCFLQNVFAEQIVYEYADDPVHTDIIPRVVNLQADGIRARQLAVPLMIEFSTEWCEYCRALEQQVLEPMLRSKDYEHSVLIRKLQVDDHNMIMGFDGDKMSSTQLGLSIGVELYPTLVFFDGAGNEVAERIIGITVMDYIPQKIDEALKRATSALPSTRSGESD